MLDFTSSLYLGMTHPVAALQPWQQLTTGVPDALGEDRERPELEARLARLMNCEAATLGSSTLHLFRDLFSLLSRQRTNVLIDTGSYPIAGWGAEMAQYPENRPIRVPHYDPDALQDRLRRAGPGPTVVVTDGFCTGCGKAAPLQDYLALMERYNGLLILDDTQSLGIRGPSPHTSRAGVGNGGGSLGYLHKPHPRVLSVASLAKGFGAPLAVIAGPQDLVSHFRRNSETRIHCSPPSRADTAALRHALDINREQGFRLRRRLQQLITLFRRVLADRGIRPGGDRFPVQTIESRNRSACRRLYEQLLGAGIQTVLRQIRCNGSCGVSLLFSVRHTSAAVQYAARELARNLRAAHGWENTNEQLDRFGQLA